MYDAFISYSHVDKPLAISLQFSLHHFAKAWYAFRAAHLFRDERELSPGARLWASVESALRESRYLLLIASPAAASSYGVNTELKLWLSERPVDTVLIARAAGVIRWNRETHTFDTSTNCIPPALRERIVHEPLWCDFGWATAPRELTIKDARFRDGVCRIAATLRGLRPDQLDGEDLRQRRRTRNTVIAVGAALAATIVGAVSQSVKARHAQDVARSRQLASQALGALTFDPTSSVRLAIASGEAAPTDEAADALRRTITGASLRMRVRNESPERTLGVVFSSGERVAILRSAKIELWDVADDRPVATRDAAGSSGIRLVPSRRSLCVISEHYIDLIDRDDLSVQLRIGPIHAKIRDVGFDPSGSHALVATDDGQITKVSLSNGSAQPAFQAVGSVKVEYNHKGDQIGLIVDRHVEVRDAASYALLASMPEHMDGFRYIVFGPADDFLMAYGAPDNKNVSIWNPTTAQAMSAFRHLDSALVAALSPDGQLVVSADETASNAVLWERTTGRTRFTLKGHGARISSAAFSPDGLFVATASRDRNVVIWDSRTGQQVAQLTGHDASVTSVAFDDTGRRVITLASDGEVRVWEMSWLPSVRIQAGQKGPRINYDDFNTVAVGFAGSGRYVAAATANDLRVYESHSGIQTDLKPMSATFSARSESWGTYRRGETQNGRSVFIHGIWKITNKGQIEIWATPAVSEAPSVAVDINTIVVADRGTLLAFTAGSNNPLWQRSIGKYIRSLTIDAARRVLMVDSDSRTAVVDGNTGTVLEDLRRTSTYDPELSGVHTVSAADVFMWRANDREPYSPFLHSSTGQATALDRFGGLCAVGRADGSIMLLDLSAGKTLATLRGHYQRIQTLSFSDDGRFLASASADGTARVWDATSSQELLRLRGHDSDVSSVALSPHLDFIVTGGLGASILVYKQDFSGDINELLSIAHLRLQQALPRAAASRAAH